MQNTHALDIAKQVFQCYRDQDFSTFKQIVHKDCTWFFPGKIGVLPWAGKFSGVEIYDFLEIIKANLEFDYYNDNIYYQDGNKVFVECEELFTVKSTGRKVLNKLIGIFTIENGKIVKYYEYADTGAMERGYVTYDQQ